MVIGTMAGVPIRNPMQTRVVDSRNEWNRESRFIVI